MVEPQILNSTVHHSGVFSIQMYTRKSAAFRNALKFNRPISQFLMCPDNGRAAALGFFTPSRTALSGTR
jgi:hypothetical protein